MKQKAEAATIDYGFTQIEGLKLENGEYCISFPQVAKYFQFESDIEVKEYIISLLLSDYEYKEVFTDSNPEPVEALNILEFSILSLRLEDSLNQLAKRLNRAAIQEFHERRFDRRLY